MDATSEITSFGKTSADISSSTVAYTTSLMPYFLPCVDSTTLALNEAGNHNFSNFLNEDKK